MTKLDTRPARKNTLTSREASKIFCGVITPMAGFFDRDDIYAVMHFLSHDDLTWKLLRQQHKNRPPKPSHLQRFAKRRLEVLNTPGLRSVELILGGLMSGLGSISDPRVVRDAMEWIVEHFDELFELADTTMKEIADGLEKTP